MSEDKNNIPAESPGPTWGDFYRKLKWAVVVVAMVTVAVLVGECHPVFDFVCEGKDEASALEKIVGTLVFTPLVLWLLWQLAEFLIQKLWETIRDVWRGHLPRALRTAIVVVAALTVILGVLLSIEKYWLGFSKSIVKDIVLIMFTVLGGVMGTLLIWAMFTSKIQGAASKIVERIRSFSLLRILFPGNKPDGDGHQQVANDESKAPVAEVAKPAEAPEPENAPAKIPAESEDKTPGSLKGALSTVGGYAQTGGGAIIGAAGKAGAQTVDAARKAGGWLKDRLPSFKKGD